MKAPDYLAIGHIAKDILPDGSFTPGGTVTFAALTAQKLGLQAAIITAAPAYLLSLPLYTGIEISSPPTEQATTFENIYTPQGRTQYIREVAPALSAQNIPANWCSPKIVHLGPIAQECAPDLFEAFPGALLGLTPQGFLRRWDAASGLVSPLEWSSARQILPKAGALILSDEDLPQNAAEATLQEYAALCHIVVCTGGPRGARVFQHGSVTHVPALRAIEVDPTGAGDVFATAFLIRLSQTGNPIVAARFAHAAAAINVEHPGASGVPTLAQVEARLALPQ